MKFNSINKNKLLIILLSSFIITSLSGCKNDSYNTPKTQIEKEEPNELEKTTAQAQENTSAIEYSENDLIVINELENLEQKLDEILETEEIKDKAKGIFITTVDFIFYDGEINGVKFDELTDSGKQKILEISTNIDLKIEKKFPNYKDEFKETAKEALNKASELISIGANNINEFAKEKLGNEYYNSLIEAKDDLVKYSKEALNIIGDYSSELYKTSKEKIKNWYEEFKNN